MKLTHTKTAETVKEVYDKLDFVRGVEAFLLGMLYET